MRRFKLIEHTADMGLKAYGKTLAGAFANAAYGMFSIIADLDEVKEVASRRVRSQIDDGWESLPRGKTVDGEAFFDQLARRERALARRKK